MASRKNHDVTQTQPFDDHGCMRIAAPLMVIAVAGLLAGCGGSPTASSSPSQSAPASAPQSSAPQAGDPQPVEQSGSGPKIVSIAPFSGMAVVTFTCANRGAEASLDALDTNGKSLSLIMLTDSGDDAAYSGTTLANSVGWGSGTQIVGYKVGCSSAWTLKQGGVATAQELPAGGTANGQGADVLRVSEHASGLHTIHVTAKSKVGETLLTIKAYNSAGSSLGLPLNEVVAKYDSDVVIPAGTAVIMLEYFRLTDWTLTAGQ